MSDRTLELRLVAKDMMSAVVEGAQKSMRGLADAVKDTAMSAAGAWPKFSASFTTTIDDIKSGVGVAQDVLGKLQQAWDFAKEGAENERIANSFQATADSVGVSAEAMAAALNKAAKGTVDDEAYMQTATRNMALGMATDLQSNVALMELARAASIKFGGSTEDAFAGMSTAIGNLQTRQLKQYGLIVDTKEANETYAKALGKTADALTEAEQRTALLNAVMEKSKVVYGDVSNLALTTAEKFLKFETQVGNLGDVAKETAVDAFTPYLDGLTLLETVTDSNASETDKLRAAYEMMRSRGIDPASEGMALLRQKIEEANATQLAATQGAYGLNGALDESSRATRRQTEATQETTAATGAADTASQARWEAMAAAAASVQLAIDNENKLRNSINLVTDAQGALTTATLFAKAAKDLDATASLELGLSMGVINSKSVDALRALQDLRVASDTNRDGFIDAKEAADGYIKSVMEIAATQGLIERNIDITITTRRFGGEITDETPGGGRSGSGGGGGGGSGGGGREALAAGGSAFGGRPYWVGEQGPEPFVPAIDGRILSRQDAMSALRGAKGGGNVINVSLQANVASQVDVDEMAYRVSEVIGRRLQAYQ